MDWDESEAEGFGNVDKAGKALATGKGALPIMGEVESPYERVRKVQSFLVARALGITLGISWYSFFRQVVITIVDTARGKTMLGEESAKGFSKPEALSQRICMHFVQKSGWYVLGFGVFAILALPTAAWIVLRITKWAADKQGKPCKGKHEWRIHVQRLLCTALAIQVGWHLSDVIKASFASVEWLEHNTGWFALAGTVIIIAACLRVGSGNRPTHVVFVMRMLVARSTGTVVGFVYTTTFGIALNGYTCQDHSALGVLSILCLSYLFGGAVALVLLAKMVAWIGTGIENIVSLVSAVFNIAVARLVGTNVTILLHVLGVAIVGKASTTTPADELPSDNSTMTKATFVAAGLLSGVAVVMVLVLLWVAERAGPAEGCAHEEKQDEGTSLLEPTTLAPVATADYGAL